MTDSIFAKVTDFCHKRLLNSKETLDYLFDVRELTQESLEKFQIGLFPNDLRELFTIATPKDLRLAGVIRHASSSTFKMQKLVMPIRDVYGNYIAIAGRTLVSEDEREKMGTPKYMNSVYKKSQHLFGLNFAKHSILQKGIAYVVEGYFDVIMPHQKGMDNVVATCGAFLSTRHLALLSRYADKVVLILDNELEAQEKAHKIVEKKSNNHVGLSACNPLGKDVKDIDEFLRKHSLDELYSCLENVSDYDDIRPFWD